MTEERLSIFKSIARDLFASENSAQALKEHRQIPVIIDILSRKDNYHVALTGTNSEKIQCAFLTSLAMHLVEGHAPKTLRDIDCLYLDANQLIIHKISAEDIQRDFVEYSEELRATNKRVVIAVNQYDPSSALGKLLQSAFIDEHWRVIILSDQDHGHGFTQIKLADPSAMQLIELLKTYKHGLEQFHHVLIPEETFTSALSMAMHYLPSQSSFDKALELLDSACARASTAEHNDHSGQKPIVTSMTLAYIISSWTQIPLTHLHNNTFQATKFVEALQRRIYGQEAAIAMMGSILQHACLKLQDKPGPLCSFLLVGPAEAGKNTTAYTMAEHLFGHKNALLQVNLSEPWHSISDIKIMSEENHSTTLLSAIQQTPYAVILLENIHQAPASTLNLFRNIFTLGFTFDDFGNKYDFSHAIIVLTTTLGSDRIAALTQAPSAQEANKTLDLMQLVLNEHPHDNDSQGHSNLSTQELCEELIPTLEGYFSSTLLQHINIVPFLPLCYSALEKTVRLKVKILAKRLETNFGIELNYAPEIVKFLAHEALWRKPQSKTLEKLLEQHLYSAVANEILAHAEDKNRPKRLALQLNDEGQLLRCEFVSAIGETVF